VGHPVSQIFYRRQNPVGFKCRIDQSAGLGAFVSNQVTKIRHFNQSDLLYLHFPFLFIFDSIDIYTDATYVTLQKTTME